MWACRTAPAIIDALGHLYGTENVLIDMLEESEQVKHAIDIVNRGWISTNEMFYQISRELKRWRGAHVMHLLAPGRLTHMQCDMSVMFSADMYGGICVDELEAADGEWLEYPPIHHFDGIEQEKHLVHILALKAAGYSVDPCGRAENRPGTISLC